jgi:hypothetical protein
MTRSQMLGDGSEEPAPIYIWERGDGFGEWEYLYPLPLIYKPYDHKQTLTLRKCLIPTFI